MSKKARNKEKKDSPWKDIPVTPYEKTLPLREQAKKSHALKEALKVRKESNSMRKIIYSKGKSVGRVQLVPVQKEIELDAHLPNGKVERVKVKVKTNQMKRITHKK